MKQLPKGTFPKLYKRTSSGAVQEWEIWVEKMTDSGRMVTRYGQQGGKKQELSEVIHEGKNRGKRNETSGYEQAVLEAEARWNKQKDRKGYGLDAGGNESAAIRAASPMLAKVFEKEARKVQWDSAFAQPKLDGFRGMARREGKKVTITSREGQPFHALTHIEDVLRNILPEGVTLDGEMYRHGLSLPQVASACKKRSELSNQIQYHVYDMLSSEDFGARNTDVYGIISKAPGDLIVRVETVKVRNQDELMVCQADFIDQGYEGAMLRYGKVGYEAGKRSSHLLKVKTFQDDEFKIVDWKFGRGKYAGMPVWTCETKEGHVFDVLCQGTLAEKRDVGSDAAKYVGDYLKVKFQYYTKTEEPVPFLPVAIGFKE